MTTKQNFSEWQICLLLRYRRLAQHGHPLCQVRGHLQELVLVRPASENGAEQQVHLYQRQVQRGRLKLLHEHRVLGFELTVKRIIASP